MLVALRGEGPRGREEAIQLAVEVPRGIARLPSRLVLSVIAGSKPDPRMTVVSS